MTSPPAASRKLLIATRNEGKIREIRDLFQGLPFELTFPVDQFLERLPDEADLERGTSFAENAVAKARYFAKRGNVPTLAEDSGLEVDALEGAPGVFSARWAEMHGAGAGDAANNALLLERLATVPDAQRTARYRCVVAYLETPLAKPQLVEATCEGRVLAEPRGTGGFGYDPLFFSLDLEMSFGDGRSPGATLGLSRSRDSRNGEARTVTCACGRSGNPPRRVWNLSCPTARSGESILKQTAGRVLDDATRRSCWCSEVIAESSRRPSLACRPRAPRRWRLSRSAPGPGASDRCSCRSSGRRESPGS